MIVTWHNLCMRRRDVLVCLTSCGHGRGNRARLSGRAASPSMRPLGVYIYAVGPQSCRIHRAQKGSARLRPRPWPRMAPLVEFGAVLGVSASLALASASGWSAHRADHRQAAVTPLPAPPLPPSSRRYAPQCFVGEYTSSPCDVSHRASDEPRRRMSLSSALVPSSLASPSIRRVFLRSPCGGAANVPRRLSFSTRLASRRFCRGEIGVCNGRKGEMFDIICA